MKFTLKFLFLIALLVVGFTFSPALIEKAFNLVPRDGNYDVAYYLVLTKYSFFGIAPFLLAVFMVVLMGVEVCKPKSQLR